jgi:predicted transcriptional regulator of viral defense system
MELTTKEYRKGLTKREATLLTTLAREDKSIFTIKDARRVLNKDAKKVMHSLAQKKWVLPLKRGLYVIVPLEIGVKGAESFLVHDFIIASVLVHPYYISYWSALNYHGLSDQIPRTVFIATTKPRKPVKALYSEFSFVKLSRKKFFGFEKTEIEAVNVNIANREKTIADCLDHPEHCGGIEEIARAIFFSHDEVDFTKITKYALRMGNLTMLKRLGYILDKCGLLEKRGNALKNVSLSKGYSILDPLAPRRGRYNERWRLLANVELKPERWMY